MPEDIAYPVISLTGCQTPERYAYHLGFSITAWYMYVGIRHVETYIVPIVSDPLRKKARNAVLAAYVAIVGVFGQGWITLQADAVDALILHKGAMRIQSVIHQLFAAMFFIGSFGHCVYSLIVYWCDDAFPIAGWHRSRWIKAACFVFPFFGSFVAMMFHPVNDDVIQHTAQNMAVAGISQVVTVLAYVGYYASYGLDLYHLTAFH